MIFQCSKPKALGQYRGPTQLQAALARELTELLFVGKPAGCPMCCIEDGTEPRATGWSSARGAAELLAEYRRLYGTEWSEEQSHRQAAYAGYASHLDWHFARGFRGQYTLHAWKVAAEFQGVGFALGSAGLARITGSAWEALNPKMRLQFLLPRIVKHANAAGFLCAPTTYTARMPDGQGGRGYWITPHLGDLLRDLVQAPTSPRAAIREIRAVFSEAGKAGAA